MSINFNREKYARDYHRAANANPMTASCPPQDEADSIRDSAIEDLGDDILAEFIGEDGYAEEIFLEVQYGQCDHDKMADASRVMMNYPDSLKAKIDFADAAMDFIQQRVAGLAEERIDED